MSKSKTQRLITKIIQNGIKHNHRSLFFVHGENCLTTAADIFEIYKNEVGKNKITVQWCHEKESDYSQKWFKKSKELSKKLKNNLIKNLDNSVERFVALTKPKYIHYSDIETILGSTCDILVLQDFEMLTPNILAQSIETVSGGGMIIFITKLTLDKIKNIKMFAHAKYCTEAFPEVKKCLFSRRFLSSLSLCKQCLIIDDNFTITEDSLERFKSLPDADSNIPVQKSVVDIKLKIKSEFAQDILNLCKTYDQGKALKILMKALHKNYSNTIALTSGRVTAPSATNLRTFFTFVGIGLDALGFNTHYTKSFSSDKEITEITITKNYTQTIRYIQPQNIKNVQVHLLIIDEAAAIPLTILKPLVGKTLTLMSSTVCGYEGTGRSLSLKLIEELREGTQTASEERKLQEVTLNECIRYNMGDSVEQWLYDLLCLEASVEPKDPPPVKAADCNLYYVDKNVIFNFESTSEEYLQEIMGLYVAAHYRNSPNDLMMLMDAPMHQLFCLLPPFEPDSSTLPEPLCVIHLSFEGQLSWDNVRKQLESRQRAFGDLIPWSVSQQYQHDCRDFYSFAGARIVRIATHPSCQKMGFGKQALQLLSDYFSAKIPLEDSKSIGWPSDSPFLIPLSHRVPEKLEYLGVSFGLTYGLVKFWKRAGYEPVYLRQIANTVTGEHSVIMLKCLNEQSDWLPYFHHQFEQKFLSLLGMPCFRKLGAKTCQELIRGFHSATQTNNEAKLDNEYILDLVPTIAQLYFRHHLGLQLNAIQSMVLLAVGTQRKKVEKINQELTLDPFHFNTILKRIVAKIAPLLLSVTDQQPPSSPLEPKPKKHKLG
ncbi:NAT10 [Cordylochernes scorpioides]|uniref:NAT10 n=1 Tax=Cordylochernes scorpioides TaxID=51811 RepID=A0ABY6KN82_9ARAC|nr:NAT10 [Cordylochernes scorpioides]